MTSGTGSAGRHPGFGAAEVHTSSEQFTASSKGTAVLDSRSRLQDSSARSAGFVISSVGTLLIPEAMSVATQLGQIAVTRIPSSHPSLRIAWQRAIKPNLLTG